MPLPIFQVDAFTARPFAGNPAAVCLLAATPSDAWLQRVAGEMNLSETAFLLEREDGFDLRWLTPAVEVDLCGHATLAAAHVLWEDGRLAPLQVARFHTRGGVLTAHRREDGSIEMDFPAGPATECAPPDELEHALGAPPLWTGRSRWDLLVELGDEKSVRVLHPDLNVLARLEVRGVIVTSRATAAGADFVSRFFAPRVGIPEDPVTGSAHCTLAPFWAGRLGRDSLVGYQVSPRGGRVGVRVERDRVALVGQAVTVLRGTLLCDDEEG